MPRSSGSYLPPVLRTGIFEESYHHLPTLPGHGSVKFFFLRRKGVPTATTLQDGYRSGETQ